MQTQSSLFKLDKCRSLQCCPSRWCHHGKSLGFRGLILAWPKQVIWKGYLHLWTLSFLPAQWEFELARFLCSLLAFIVSKSWPRLRITFDYYQASVVSCNYETVSPKSTTTLLWKRQQKILSTLDEISSWKKNLKGISPRLVMHLFFVSTWTCLIVFWKTDTHTLT